MTQIVVPLHAITTKPTLGKPEGRTIMFTITGQNVLNSWNLWPKKRTPGSTNGLLAQYCTSADLATHYKHSTQHFVLVTCNSKTKIISQTRMGPRTAALTVCVSATLALYIALYKSQQCQTHDSIKTCYSSWNVHRHIKLLTVCEYRENGYR
jgi:hypothetical protein